MELNTIYIFLNLLATINMLLLIVFLSCRKQNTLPNVIMAISLSIPGLYLIDNVLICSKLIYYFPYFFFIVQIIANIFPIAVYYYVHLLLGDRKKFNRILISGTVLVFAYSIWLLVHFILMDESGQGYYLDVLISGEEYPITMDIYNLGFYAWQMVYFVVLLIEIRKYQVKVEQNLSNLNTVKLTFVKRFITLLAILNLVLVIFYSIFPMTVVDYGVLPIIIGVIYSYIIFFSIKNNAILSPASYKTLNKINYQLIFGKENEIESQNLNQEEDKNQQFELIESNIKKALDEDKIYRTADITLSLLAENISEKPYLVSKVLNVCFNKSFYDIINEHRINEALSLLKTFDSKLDKIDNIAYQVGFNSRATFYRSFKKITGKNPTEFIPLS